MKTIYSDINTEITARLRATRKSKSMSQKDLASILGESQSFVSKVESQERRLDVVEFLAWCDALDVDPMQMLPGRSKDS